jgi:hypothetical protein
MKLRKAATNVAPIVALLTGFVASSYAEEEAPSWHDKGALTAILKRVFSGQGTESESDRAAREAFKSLWKYDYDRGREFLKKAISSHANDAGIKYDPLQPADVDENDMDYGREQVAKMLADRPQMKLFLNSQDDLYWWAVRKFGAKMHDSRIEWNSAAPAGAEAQHRYPFANRPGSIQVRPISPEEGSESQEFERLWMRTAFELHNIEGARRFKQISVLALDKQIKKEEYVRAMFGVEYTAIERIRVWYADIYLPHAKKYNLETNPREWYCDFWGTESECFERYADRSGYPWVPYGKYYEQYQERRSWLDRALTQPERKSFGEMIKGWFSGPQK